MTIEDKIEIFQKNLLKDFEDDIFDYFFLDYDRNDIKYNKVRFSFLDNLKSEKEIIKVLEGITSSVIKHEHHDNLENIIESYISRGFIILEDKNHLFKEFSALLTNNKNILY